MICDAKAVTAPKTTQITLGTGIAVDMDMDMDTQDVAHRAITACPWLCLPTLRTVLLGCVVLMLVLLLVPAVGVFLYIALTEALYAHVGYRLMRRRLRFE